MALVARLALWILHLSYSLFLAILSIRSRFFRPAPRSLTATRNKTPSHLALVLASQEPDLCVSEAQEAFLRCTEEAIACCRAVGIRCLSVYDRLGEGSHSDLSSLLNNCAGILIEASDVVNERLESCLPLTPDKHSLADAVFPLTPPLSDDSDVSDDCYFKGKSCIKTICAGDTTDRLRKWGRNRPRIQRHCGFS
jgi:dehydrodolichyl diphosphate syntase complex subunit NUS1